MSATRGLATLAIIISIAAGCSSRPAPDVAPVANSALAGRAPEGTHHLEAVDGLALPVRLQVPRDTMPGVATPAGMEIIAGVISFPMRGWALLTLHMRLLDCGPAALGRAGTSPAVCRPTAQDDTVDSAIPFTYSAGRMTVTWPTGSRRPAEVTQGTVRGDTITLDLPFRRVYGPGHPEATWTQQFTFVRTTR